MEKIINYLNEKVLAKEKGVDALISFSKCPGCRITSSGLEILSNARYQLQVYRDKLELISRYKVCTCNKFIRNISKEKIDIVDGIIIFRCKKCKGHFSK